LADFGDFFNFNKASFSNCPTLPVQILNIFAVSSRVCGYSQLNQNLRLKILISLGFRVSNNSFISFFNSLLKIFSSTFFVWSSTKISKVSSLSQIGVSRLIVFKLNSFNSFNFSGLMFSI
jgi:hypothetical protein